MLSNFKKFVENIDIFGFNNKQPKSPLKDDDKPFKMFDIKELNDSLMKLKFDYKEPRMQLNDEIIWKDQLDTNSLKVGLSSLGSFRATIRRSIKNSEGQTSWICEKVIPIKDGDKELQISERIENSLRALIPQNESSAKEFNTEKLAVNISKTLRAANPKFFSFNKLYKIKENNYIVEFNMVGGGVGSPNSQRVEQFHINLNFDESTGLIRIWGNNIVSPWGGHSWQSAPSEFNEFFTPTQSIKHIVECVKEIILCY